MRKYREIAKTYLKTQFAWRADVIFNIIFTVTRIIFAYLLWGIIFQNRTMVGDFTFHGMLSYYIVSSFLSQLEMSSGVSNEIHFRIRNGTFSKYMIIPVGIERYFIAMQVGVMGFYLIFDFLAAIIWVFLFRIEFVLTKDILVILCTIVIILLGLLFMIQLNYFLGLLTLKYQGIGTFLMIKDNIMSLITGSIVPLVLFPEGVVRAMRILPFYYVTYLPTMLLTGHCKEEAISGMFILVAWCIVMQVAIHAVWNRYIRKYDGVGI